MPDDVPGFVAMRMRWTKAAFTFGASFAVVGAMVFFFARYVRPAKIAPSQMSAHAAVAAKPAPEAAARRLSFNDDIQPILSEHCFQCHGPDPESRKGCRDGA